MIKMQEMYPLILDAFKEGLSFSFPIHGTSMQPLLHTGDIVKIIPPTNLRKGDIVLYKRTNDQFVLHRIYDITESSFKMIGDHQIEIEEGIQTEQIIAKVISYKKNNKKKEHKLKGIKYRIYKFLIRFIFIHKFFLKFHL